MKQTRTAQTAPGKPVEGNDPTQSAWPERKSYAIGFALALGLTMASFGIVWFKLLPYGQTLITLSVLALLQVIAQFRFFLHIDLSRSKREDLQLILFTGLLIAMMVGGSIWILASLDARMM